MLFAVWTNVFWSDKTKVELSGLHAKYWKASTTHNPEHVSLTVK